jgi:hypothetical protein
MEETIVDIPGVGEVVFPNSMSKEDISKAAKKLYDESLQKQTTAPKEGSIVSKIPVEGAFTPASAPRQEPSLMDKIIGTGETGLTLLTGATGGTVGTIGGTLSGIAESIGQGTFGTQQGRKLAEQRAAEYAGSLTYKPRTAEGQERTQAVGEFLQEVVPPFVPMIGSAGQIGASAKATIPTVSYTARRVANALEKAPPTATVVNGKVSAGAAASPDALRRVTVAENLPVPFTGPSGLTSGQATRNFNQLQFEKEAAKLAETGQPLRERIENQTATFIRNFDALVDREEPMKTGKRDIGVAVSSVLETKAEAVRKRINKLYEEADNKGETKAPIDMSPVVPVFNELSRYEGVANNIPTIRREAQRLGIIQTDNQGNIQGSSVTLKNAEVLRQFINEVTDWQDPRQALLAKRIKGSIDVATENKGGELYKKARKLREDYSNEFENVGLTSKLLSTKRGTDERQVAFEDVFDKIILMSSIDETNKLRKTLLTAGAGGKQAWADLKAAGINYIKEASLSASQQDAKGNPLLSPDKLNRVIKQLDEEGKLESLYGKQQAQQLRDLAELSTVIYTAPPGSINTSNTASALQVALDSSLTYGVSGFPAPVVTILKEGSKFIKNRETKKRIQEALKPVKE